VAAGAGTLASTFAALDDRKDSTVLAALLADLAQGFPSLPGASCQGRQDLFDATIQNDDDADDLNVRYARRAAQRVCGACPVLDACAAWVDSLPRGRRPVGVVGGALTDVQGRRWAGDRESRLPRNTRK
jgi:hypothetical protein